MADERSTIAGLDKRVAIFGGVVGILAALTPIGISMARVDPAITELRSQVLDREKANDATNARIDRIEESRSLELQRLSKTEEVAQSTRDMLAQIVTKLDRVLMRR